jgi:hypothetical protein
MSGSLGKLVTLTYFYEEIARFRDVMCSTNYTEEQKQRAFEGLSLVYLNFSGAERDWLKVERCFVATSEEFIRRQIMDSLRARGLTASGRTPHAPEVQWP